MYHPQNEIKTYFIYSCTHHHNNNAKMLILTVHIHNPRAKRYHMLNDGTHNTWDKKKKFCLNYHSKREMSSLCYYYLFKLCILSLLIKHTHCICSESDPPMKRTFLSYVDVNSGKEQMSSTLSMMASKLTFQAMVLFSDCVRLVRRNCWIPTS